jgi:hypothetical protein
MSVKTWGERIGLGLFLAVFFFGGLAGFHLITLRPLWRFWRAHGWSQVRCTVTSATVHVHRGEDGETYEYTLGYRYELGGREYVSERYDLGGIQSGPTKEAFESHPKGSRTMCFVDPGEPGMAVLDRGQPGGWGFGVFPLLAAGLAGLFAHVGLRPRR